jgi:chorismate synthase
LIKENFLNQGNTFGQIFRITTWGESHGGGVGVVIDGCPPRIRLTPQDIQNELNRRKPGQSKITTQRREKDQPEILSGVFEGKTLGTPIHIWVKNLDARASDYREIKEKFRPSHADFTYEKKYGIRNWQGGGRASARETIGRVAAAAVAKKVLEKEKIHVLAYVKRVHDIEADIDPEKVTLKRIEQNIIRCPDPKTAQKMIDLIQQTQREGDSLGGVIEAVALNVPVGLGQPVFSKLEADLAAGLMSLPASKGFEVGSGFSGTYLKGSEHNDIFIKTLRGIRTKTNYSGGIQGGISNGMPIIVRVAFKPTATILKEQDTVNRKGRKSTLKPKGRHDPCVLPRAVPMVEAMIQLVLVDHFLLHRAQCG